jgi:exonuclease VII small subunit
MAEDIEDGFGDEEEADPSPEARIAALEFRVSELEHKVRALDRVVKPYERRWWRDLFR